MRYFYKSMLLKMLLIAGVAPWGASLLMMTIALGESRYVSIAPSTTEILYALGLEEQIVGVSTYCNYPPEAQSKPKVGDFSHPNMETIAALKPDYIFCTGLEQTPVITELRRLKFKVYNADPSNMAELFQTISDIGNITKKKEAAADLISAMRTNIELIQKNVQNIPQDKKIKVFIEIWRDPLMTAGKGSFIDELITLAAGVNVAHDVIRPYCTFSAEKVISLNPDCIILAYMDKEQPLKLIERRLGWSSIDAVKNNKVYYIDPDILLRPGPRVTLGLKTIYQKLYPVQ
jgi:iron complex transport system substrate-binding protein